MLKKYAIFLFIIGALIVFQSTFVYNSITVRDVGPDFLMIIVVAISFFLGSVSGEIFGFITGIIADIISGGLLGLSAFTYTVIGYGVGLLGNKIYGNYYILSIFIVFVATFVKALIMAMLGSLFIKPGYFGFFTHGRIFLEAVMNGVISPLFFLIVYKIENRVTG